MTPQEQLQRSTPGRLPPLHHGDHLTRAEFERRSAALPENMKVELLDGVVYMSAATKLEHGTPHGLIDTWLGTYAYATPGTDFSTNTTLRLDEIAQPQPDAFLRVLPEAGGLSRTDEEGYCHGPLELAAEVAASSASYDLHEKKAIFLRNGIREYVVLVVHEARVEWFALDGGVYLPIEADRRGIMKSRIFPGLWLDARALVRGEGAKVLAVLGRGLESRPHTAFTQVLARSLRAGRRKR